MSMSRDLENAAAATVKGTPFPRTEGHHQFALFQQAIAEARAQGRDLTGLVWNNALGWHRRESTPPAGPRAARTVIEKRRYLAGRRRLWTCQERQQAVERVIEADRRRSAMTPVERMGDHLAGRIRLWTTLEQQRRVEASLRVDQLRHDWRRNGTVVERLAWMSDHATLWGNESNGVTDANAPLGQRVSADAQHPAEGLRRGARRRTKATTAMADCI
jgi:hypothetical protein